jgi:hypothetical protein
VISCLANEWIKALLKNNHDNAAHPNYCRLMALYLSGIGATKRKWIANCIVNIV